MSRSRFRPYPLCHIGATCTDSICRETAAHTRYQQTRPPVGCTPVELCRYKGSSTVGTSPPPANEERIVTEDAASPHIAGTGAESWHGKRSTYIRKKCRCVPCRASENAYQRSRYATVPEKRAQSAAAAERYRERNRDLVNHRQREKTAADPEPSRRKSRKHYEGNRAYYAGKNRKWRENNPEAEAAKTRRGWDAWAARNPDEIRTSKRRWAAANTEAQRENTRRRRARVRELTIVPFTSSQLRARLTMWSGCWICGGPKEAVDHVKPCAVGGAHMLGNLRPICRRCNSGKGSTWRGSRWAVSLGGRPGSWKVSAS
jgi:hypothetical protein